MLYRLARLAAWLAASLLVIPLAVAAPSLQFDVDGQLTGARNVLVDGSLYDVKFVDGTCRDAVLSYFTATPDCDIFFTQFAFNTAAGAAAASQALLDQVFIDGLQALDSDPSLTAGCEGSTCSVFTPYGVHVWVGYENMLLKIYYMADFAQATNLAVEPDAVTGPLAVKIDYTTVDVPDRVWADWAPAATPEPASPLLVATGLTIWWLVRRQRAPSG